MLWHEFCHHWAYSVYNYSGHQRTFDKCLRTNKKLWLLGSFSRIIPML
nr:MAG TPA: SprT-like family protein [Caudoviricetes sp.]